MNKKKCLKADGACLVYLAEEDGIPVIVKETSQSEHARLLENEYRLLERIRDSGEPWASSFPRPIRLTKGKTTSLVRSYIPGVTLETLTEAKKDRPGLSADRAAEIVLSVLETIRHLHGMRPPIIQRDIKPQNIIVNENGCHIVDMGISRTLTGKRPRDTVVIGTPLTAPPEQFGFRGTDERSDIYSVGVLFSYLLTGEYGLRQPGLPPRSRRIIRRATAFDPDRRYRSAGQMAAAVRRMTRRSPLRRALPLAAALLAAVLLILFPAARKGPHRFREPLIEKAVRYQLGRPEGALDREALASVTSLSVFGKQVGIREEDIWFLGDDPYIRDEGLREAGLWKDNGGISSLADLKALPNLREVGLYNQNIVDISVLKELRLTSVGLGYNPVTDISALKSCPGIERLNLTCLPCDPSETLAAMTGLKELSVAGVPMNSLRALESPELESLNLFGTGSEGFLSREAWQSLERMPALRKLTINKLDQGILDSLVSSFVTDLEVTHSNGVSLAELQRLPRLTRLYFYSDEEERVDASPLIFPQLEWLDVKNVTLESLSCLSEMKKLSTLHIYAAKCLDLGGLEGLESLRVIYCSEAQRGALREKYPDAPWQLR